MPPTPNTVTITWWKISIFISSMVILGGIIFTILWYSIKKWMNKLNDNVTILQNDVTAIRLELAKEYVTKTDLSKSDNSNREAHAIFHDKINNLQSELVKQATICEERSCHKSKTTRRKT